MKTLLLTAAFFAFCLVTNPVLATSEVPGKSGYAPVNGIKIYYEVHGQGDGLPLVLLNGGGSSIAVTYSKILPIFAQHRKVVAMEEQGHGRTSDRDKPFRAETSAEDVAGLLYYLKIKKADVMGFSNGAGVAMQLAIRHPELVHKLIYASYLTRKDGAQPGFWDFMKKADFKGMPQPLKDAFLKVNPDPEKLRNMAEKDIERMQHFTDMNDEDLKKIKAPTFVIAGDQDVPTPEHAVELSHKIPNARLMILPGGHGEYLGELLTGKPGSHAPEFTAGFLEEFLNAPDPAK